RLPPLNAILSPARTHECVTGCMLVTKNNPPENDIMQRVVGRDGDALAELYDLYAARVFGLCLRILNENQLAEDALQEVFLRVWQRSQLFEQTRGTVNTWVMGIARNACIDQLRRS